MILLWRVRYLDSRDRQFKDRDLFLDTRSLEAPTRAAVECICETGRPGVSERAILRFRHLFQERPFDDPELGRLIEADGHFNSFSLVEYFEDENGEELSNKDMARILSGGQTAVMFGPFHRPHDIELSLSPPAGPIDVGEVALSQDDIDCLAYFVRDTRELAASEFHQNGPGTLQRSEGSYEIKTATTADEVRSYVTVFRKLYMTGERGCFANAAQLFQEKIDHPIGDWVYGEFEEYRRELDAPPRFYPGFGDGSRATFSRKNILDAFIYTKYAHQPQKNRIRLYRRCLSEVPAEEVLTWLFFCASHQAGLHFLNAARPIGSFLSAYLRETNSSPSFSWSGLHEEHGLGSMEKPKAKRERIVREKAEELALRLWQEAGRPTGGPTLFFREAERQIREQLGI